MLPILPALLVLAFVPAQESRPPQPALRFQKSLRLPVKPKPALASAPRKAQDRPGAVVEVLGENRSLETVREQTLREFRDWIIANRFHGTAFGPAFQPVLMTTASWEQTHPGGFTVAPLAPLGWGY